MGIGKIFQILVPKDKKFMPLFHQSAANMISASEQLIMLMKEPSAEAQILIIKQIKEIERKGDNYTHDIFEELNSTFITPFDREDIHELASTLDDVLDLINNVSNRMELIKNRRYSNTFLKMAEQVHESCIELYKAVKELENLKNPEKIKSHCKRVSHIEGAADELFHQAIIELFENEKDAIELIKIRDVLATLEAATDKAEDVADVIKAVIVKNA